VTAAGRLGHVGSGGAVLDTACLLNRFRGDEVWGLSVVEER
jgi:hypothetical protein